jgi:hypothetical protein
MGVHDPKDYSSIVPAKPYWHCSACHHTANTPFCTSCGSQVSASTITRNLCSGCGRHGDGSYCQKCGGRIVSRVEHPEAPKLASHPLLLEWWRRLCARCGERAYSGDRNSFCARCGARSWREESSSILHCVKCNTNWSIDNGFAGAQPAPSNSDGWDRYC